MELVEISPIPGIVRPERLIVNADNFAIAPYLLMVHSGVMDGKVVSSSGEAPEFSQEWPQESAMVA